MRSAAALARMERALDEVEALVPGSARIAADMLCVDLVAMAKSYASDPVRGVVYARATVRGNEISGQCGAFRLVWG